MMAAKHLVGHMEPYILGENFLEYIERLENYLELNSVEDDKFKVLLLCNLMGSEASAKLSKACKPKKPKQFDYEEIIKKSKELFTKKVSSCVNAVKFNKRIQQRGETIHDFAMELIMLAEECQFGAYKDKALRNQLIMGIMNKRLKVELMSLEESKTFDEMLQKCVAAEIISKDVEVNMKMSWEEQDINKLYHKSRNNDRDVGRRTSSHSQNLSGGGSQDYGGSPNYGGRHNYFYESEREDSNGKRSRSNKRNFKCYACQEFGHMARECPSQGASSANKNINKNLTRSMFAGDSIKCYVCQGFGHMARECPSQGASSSNIYINKRYKNFNSNKSCNSARNENCPKGNGVKSVSENQNVGEIELENFDFGQLSLHEVDKASFNNITRDDRELALRIDVSKIDELVINENVQLKKTKQCDSLGYINLNSVNLAQVNMKYSNVEFIDIIIENKVVKMEIDTGACVSLCTRDQYQRNFAQIKLDKVEIPLSVVTGDTIKIMGKIQVNAKMKVNDRDKRVELIIVDTPKKMFPLCGRDWLDIFYADWRDWFRIKRIDGCLEFRKKVLLKLKTDFEVVFDGDLRTPIKDFVVNIPLLENSKPIFHRAYTLPFSLRGKVEKELEQLQRDGIIEPVTVSEWASPIVVVPKQDGQIRICVDCSVTINKLVKPQYYPLPVIDEVLASLAGCKFFVSLDLKGAYTQLKLSNEAQQLLTINTHRGLYAYKRMPYGLRPASAIFQSIMDQILNNIPNTYCYIDDILIGDVTLEGLRDKLVLVLQKLRNYGVKVNYGKCKFFEDKLTYLGHELSASGVGPCSDKIKAIVEAPSPSSVTELKSFIGLLNYYSKFLPKLNQKCSVFYRLLQKNAKWDWDSKCQGVFEQSKHDIVNSQILEFYDPKKEIRIVCDASDAGLSGILCHVIDNVEKPVFFVSRTLTRAEKNYPILHREALAVVFSMEKFYKYIYGHRVTIYSDHKPLEGIFCQAKGQSSVIASRLQRYKNRLVIFDYVLKYRKGSENGNADCLSRLPIKDKLSEEDQSEQMICVIDHIENGDVTKVNIELVKRKTDDDLYLSELRDYIGNGWNQRNVPSVYKNYYLKNLALSVEKGCILYGERLVIPRSIQQNVLKLMHCNHTGIVRMKVLARQYFYWEGIDGDIAKFVGQCESCQLTSREKQNKVYLSWPIVKYPFQRIHVDFFYFQRQVFLIVIDAYSRWLEVILMNGTNVHKVIEKLESIFRVFGLPEELVSDNGPPFGSEGFKEYCSKNDIKLTHSPPYHPASNGRVERAVQTTKSVLKKYVLDSERSQNSFDVKKSVDKFLKNYNNLPCTDEHFIPAEKVFSYKPRTLLDLIKLQKQNTDQFEHESGYTKDLKKRIPVNKLN